MAKSINYKRIAIITGATSGIGEATARKFVGDGFAVIGNGRTAKKLAELEKELGAAFVGVVGDVADVDVQEQLFDAAISHFGHPADIVVANAGRGLGGSITTSDIAQFEEVLRTNVLSVVELLQKATKKMLDAQQHSKAATPQDIVLIGSVVGRHISPFSAAYSSSKFAVHCMAESLRREMASKGIRVSLVEPGFVLSGFQAVAGYTDDLVQSFKDKFGPLLIGEDIAEAIHFIVTRPAHVCVGDIVVRPARQDYP